MWINHILAWNWPFSSFEWLPNYPWNVERTSAWPCCTHEDNHTISCCISISFLCIYFHIFLVISEQIDTSITCTTLRSRMNFDNNDSSKIYMLNIMSIWWGVRGIRALDFHGFFSQAAVQRRRKWYIESGLSFNSQIHLIIAYKISRITACKNLESR